MLTVFNRVADVLPEPVKTEESKIKTEVDAAVEKAKEAISDGESQAHSVLDDIKSEIPKLSEDGKKLAHDAIDKVKKDLSEGKNALHKFFDQVVASVSSATTYVVDATKTSSAKAKEELKNPVVATQAVVTIGAITGLIVGIQERAKIFKDRSDLEITAILTGLVGVIALDGFLFIKNYDKYKKSLK